VIEMLFDRTKLHEFRLWYHFGYFRYLPNLMQKIGIALPSCIRQRAEERVIRSIVPNEIFSAVFYHRLLAFENRSSFVRNPYVRTPSLGALFPAPRLNCKIGLQMRCSAI